MSEQQEHGLSFTSPNASEFIDKSPVIRALINKYVSLAEGEKYTVDDIMNIMNVVVGLPTFFMFLAEKDGYGVGLMTAHAVRHDDVKAGGMIHIGVVDETVSKKDSHAIITEAMHRLDEWARGNGMDVVFAQTKRSEKPFDKLLTKYGWQRITTVYEKEISHGKSEESSTTASGPVATRISGAVV